jgi:hypothetical protein
MGEGIDRIITNQKALSISGERFILNQYLPQNWSELVSV